MWSFLLARKQFVAKCQITKRGILVMRIKTALIGLLAAIAMAIPVLAAGAAQNNSHPIGISVAFYNPDYPPSGLFANWSGHSLLSFGVTDNTNPLTIVGLRISANSGQRARNFQFDINSQNGKCPFIEVWAVEKSASAPSLYISDMISDLGSGDGFTFKDLKNGFTRVFFNAANNNCFDSDTAFSNIYIADYAYCGCSFQDSVNNEFVNTLAVANQIQPKPEFDSTLDFNF
jgi:hypothetical protein